MSNAAPAKPKKTGEKIMLIFLSVIAYFFNRVSELAIAIPAAKAPTMGDNPKTAARRGSAKT